MIIGLAGKSCSGKNRFARYLEEKGAVHLDLDRLNHMLLDKNSLELAGLFGGDILNTDGTVNRPVLSALVFSDSGKLEKLEKFIHPLIEREVEETVIRSHGKIVLLNGAVLHKSTLANRIPGLIWMYSPYPLRIFRALKRDDRNLANIIKRFSSQRQFSAQQFPSHVDIYKVYNGFLSRPLERKAGKLYDRLMAKGEDL